MTDLSRRGLLRSAAWGPVLAARVLHGQSWLAIARVPGEWSFSSGRTYPDPFHDLELDVVFTDARGKDLRVPAYWAGDQTWRVRFAAPAPGSYRYRTVSTDTSNRDLHDRTGRLEVSPYSGTNPLYRHGPIQVSANRRHFEHADGVPFFWLGDTWWMGLCRRLRWPEDFQLLTADRVRKGFNVVQIVAGLYPDMPPMDPRGANEAGFPWEKEFTRIRPAYFDAADLRIRHLAENGIVPCIVGCWAYFLPLLGVERMKRHWRYLVARWGAYPVVWCLAGEGTMPYYLSTTKEKDAELQKSGWTELGRYVKSIDPYRHPVTIHPRGSSGARENVADSSAIDFDMLQTGHGDRDSIPSTVRLVTAAYAGTPAMPVLNGEVCYEGIVEASRQEIQRFMFWSCVLSGAAGHTYGANGIWQVNNPDQPFGASPHGQSWGDTPWQEAYQLPGSANLGLARRLLERYEWWRMEPHPEWIEPHWTSENYRSAFAAGIPGKLRILFLPVARRETHRVKKLETGKRYRAFFFNPATGKQQEIGVISGDAAGDWLIPPGPIFQDWVVVLEAAG